MEKSICKLLPISVRDYEEHQVLLFNLTPKHKDFLEEVPESALQPGDILLFPFDSCSGKSSGSFKHAAVYCGDGEVIHFQKTSLWEKSGRIVKDGFRAMKKQRKECQVYRKKGGIDLREFRRKVRTAMNCEAEYSLLRNNCIHFALFLLGLADFYMEIVQTEGDNPDEGDSCSGEASSNCTV